MKEIIPFKIEQVPHHSIVLAATSEPDYEMNRVYICENWPEYGDFTVVYGSHCSCYGFDDTKWEATTYTEDELAKLLRSWAFDGWGVDGDRSRHLWHGVPGGCCSTRQASAAIRHSQAEVI